MVFKLVAVRGFPAQSFVSKFERGERRLDVIEFLEVADAIGLDASQFIAKLTQPRRQERPDRFGNVQEESLALPNG